MIHAVQSGTAPHYTPSPIPGVDRIERGEYSFEISPGAACWKLEMFHDGESAGMGFFSFDTEAESMDAYCEAFEAGSEWLQ